MDKDDVYRRTANKAQYNRKQFIALAKENDLPAEYVDQYDRDTQVATNAQAGGWSWGRAFMWPVFLAPILAMAWILFEAISWVLHRASVLFWSHL